jgi:spermidine/putrescine transport system permease protein
MTFAERYGRWRRSEGVRGLLMVSPTGLYALAMLAIPLAAIVAFSFFTQTGVIDIDYSPTLDNYREALGTNRLGAIMAAEDGGGWLTRIGAWWSRELYLQLILRSVIISLTVTAATVLLAFPVAYFVSFHVEPNRKSMWLFMITIPFWTSYLIRVFLWKVILGFNGVINASLMGLGIIDSPLTAINYNATAVVITLAHAYAPFAILPIFVALERIDRSLLEAGQDLGETRFSTFLRVTLPLAMPGVVAAVLIVFIPTIGDYVTPRLVGGAGGTMISNMIQTQFLKLNNTPLGASLSVLVMLLVSAISLLFIFLNRRYLRGPR